MKNLAMEQPLGINRQDEIGELAVNLNEMTDNLSRTLQQLQEEMEKERKQEKQRQELFTAISHELKTPLTIIKGQLQGMIDQVGTYKDRDAYLVGTLATTAKMEEMIQQLLFVSQLEKAEMTFTTTPVKMDAWLAEIVKNHEELASSKDIFITYYVADDVVFDIDRNLFTHALNNILTNAIFYSPNGEMIDIQIDENSIRVENTGVHLEEEELEKIFLPFYRLDKSRNRHTGGSGLGLYIVASIMRLHGFDCLMRNSEDGVVFEASYIATTAIK
jgi:two-component system sensor histidine kinase VanS